MSDKNEMTSHHGIDDEMHKKYANETIRLLHERSSCRSFTDKTIPPDVVDTVLKAGIHAPTGGNLQPYSIIKIENKETAVKLAEICNQSFIGQAPLNLLFCIDWYRLKRWAELKTAPFSANSSFRHFWISFQDTIIAAQNICTAADAVGLGSVYIGTVIDNINEIKKIFNLPQYVFPVVLLTIGYPKVRPKSKKKLGIDVIVHSEKYQDISDETIIDAFENKYPDLKIEITEERLNQISEVCRDVHGEEFAEKCLLNIKETGYINPVQRYFGLHYVANLMPQYNEQFTEQMKSMGFNWFDKYKPDKDNS